MRTFIVLSLLAFGSSLRLGKPNRPEAKLKSSSGAFSSITGGLSSGQHAAWQKFKGWSSARAGTNATWDTNEQAAWDGATHELVAVLRPESTDKKLLEAQAEQTELLQHELEAKPKVSLLQSGLDDKRAGEKWIMINHDKGFCYEADNNEDYSFFLTLCVGVYSPSSWGCPNIAIFPARVGPAGGCKGAGFTVAKGPEKYYPGANVFLNPLGVISYDNLHNPKTGQDLFSGWFFTQVYSKAFPQCLTKKR